MLYPNQKAVAVMFHDRKDALVQLKYPGETI